MAIVDVSTVFSSKFQLLFQTSYLRNEISFAADVKQQALPPHLPLGVKETTINHWCQQRLVLAPGVMKSQALKISLVLDSTRVTCHSPEALHGCKDTRTQTHAELKSVLLIILPNKLQSLSRFCWEILLKGCHSGRHLRSFLPAELTTSESNTRTKQLGRTQGDAVTMQNSAEMPVLLEKRCCTKANLSMLLLSWHLRWEQPRLLKQKEMFLLHTIRVSPNLV